MDQVYAGMTVQDATGPIGVVESIEGDTTMGNAQVVVLRDDGERFTLTPGMYMVVGDVLHIGEGAREMGVPAQATANTARHSGIPAQGYDPMRTQELPTIDVSAQRASMDVPTGQEVRIPVIREEAIIHTREVEQGGVRVHKTVHEREEVVEHPTMRENVDVERVSIGRVVEAVPQVREEGDTLIIPVLEEMLVVEKRLVLKEEIRITRRRTTEMEQARVVLNEEQVTVERIDERTAGM